ncbi:hypothetical protein G7085_19625 [Tessaracoccus sp. HDW20]|uniref:hypothetical protein n=1 Tax=Tessaracoccus coleopterorum TaxID=2714950 RepID=UPI0018D3F72A|nr:hypothetical protein [Tessaracoccus coleopterorum]NHB86003.1 hypothetical protein [Tessaracoccus coleopterorum]
MTGRALGLIDGLGFDLQPAGWRLTPHASAEHRRARAQWRHDLDDAEELLQDFTGVLKVGVAGRGRSPRPSSDPPATGCWPTTAPAANWPRRSGRASPGLSPT